MVQPRARAIREEPAPAAPRRRCVATRASDDKANLIRFVVGPEDRLVPDVAGKLPGHGLWLQARRQVVEGAARRNPFAKLVGRRVVVAPDLADQVEHLLERRCRELIGLARRAGQAVQGRERVVAKMERGEAGLILIAADAGTDAARMRRVAAAAGVTVATALDRAALGACFGRESAVFAAIGAGPLAESLADDLGRLSGFRGAAIATPEPLGAS